MTFFFFFLGNKCCRFMLQSCYLGPLLHIWFFFLGNTDNKRENLIIVFFYVTCNFISHVSCLKFRDSWSICLERFALFLKKKNVGLILWPMPKIKLWWPSIQLFLPLSVVLKWFYDSGDLVKSCFLYLLVYKYEFPMVKFVDFVLIWLSNFKLHIRNHSIHSGT